MEAPLTDSLEPAAPVLRRPPLVFPILVAFLALMSATLLLYSPAATWVSALNQSAIVDKYPQEVEDADPTPARQLEAAHAYNEALSSGAELPANTRVPVGQEQDAVDGLSYASLLTTPSNVMSRLQIPSIDVDLPIYHGTSDAVLLQGIGHLEGTSLPVGGTDTHSVLTAHRGLANALMFTHLDQLAVGENFTVTTFGEVMTYRVITTKVVEPEDNESLRQEAGKDLVTLVTCTPLGINTQRILVTAERITPTTPQSIAASQAPADVLGFPWWAAVYGTVLILLAVYVWRSTVRPWRGYRRKVRAAEEAAWGDEPYQLPFK